MKKFILLLFIFTAAAKPAFAVDISAESAYVIDAATGTGILERDCDTRLPMASTTKITTAITAIENGNLESVITITNEDAAIEGSSTYLDGGDQVTLEELLYGLMLNSGNDAAEAIARAVGGDTETFVEMMNETAAKAGAENTHYDNPSGLDSPEHYTTAKDLAKIARYAMKNEVFADIVSTKAHKAVILNAPDKEKWFANHNKLLRTYEGCIGVKTGYTKSDGRCLVSAATRYGMTFIAVTLNDPDDWNDHAAMLDYCFNNYVAKKIISASVPIKTETIGGREYEFYPEKDFAIAENVNSEPTDTVTEIHMKHNIITPLKSGDPVGYASVYMDGAEIGRVNIISPEAVETKTLLWPSYGIRDWCRYLAAEWLRF